ncbi:MAG: hydrogenase iron-sulfur subunit [Candidatus Lokiarchaeota archaeon]|nr:hydrogenase iron-sulfur subunit [Candidatus Lokiarchaeota archaeon]
MSETKPFKPKILAFCCNWCSYAGIDIAGISHHEYPASIRIIKVMCIGRVHPDLVLEAFARGADGVLIVGCNVGDCHYLHGNQLATERLTAMQDMLEGLGIDKRRLAIGYIFAYEGAKFADLATTFTNEVSALGPNRIKTMT